MQLPAAPSSKTSQALSTATKPAKGKGASKKDKSLVTVAAGTKRTRKQASVDALTKNAVAAAATASVEDDSWTEQPTESLHVVPLSAPAEPALAQSNPLQEHGSATDLRSNADAASSTNNNKDTKKEADGEDSHDLTANESLDLTTKRSKISKQ